MAHAARGCEGAIEKASLRVVTFNLGGNLIDRIGRNTG
jgi:hypothetical protein